MVCFSCKAICLLLVTQLTRALSCTAQTRILDQRSPICLPILARLPVLRGGLERPVDPSSCEAGQLDVAEEGAQQDGGEMESKEKERADQEQGRVQASLQRSNDKHVTSAVFLQAEQQRARQWFTGPAWTFGGLTVVQLWLLLLSRQYYIARGEVRPFFYIVF